MLWMAVVSQSSENSKLHVHVDLQDYIALPDHYLIDCLQALLFVRLPLNKSPGADRINNEILRKVRYSIDNRA